MIVLCQCNVLILFMSISFIMCVFFLKKIPEGRINDMLIGILESDFKAVDLHVEWFVELMIAAMCI